MLCTSRLQQLQQPARYARLQEMAHDINDPLTRDISVSHISNGHGDHGSLRQGGKHHHHIDLRRHIFTLDYTYRYPNWIS